MILLRSHRPSNAVPNLFGRPEASTLIDAAWHELKHLEPLYPGFREWYWGKVVPGLDLGTRRIFASYANNQLGGLVIAKAEAEETKICTVWVSRHLRQKRVARNLMSEALDWLGTEKPLFTVPNARISEFATLIKKFDFDHKYSIKNYYGFGREEHVFNGILKACCQA